MVSAISLLFSVLFMCMGAYYATKARDSELATQGMLRKLTSKVDDLELESIRAAGHIKRILGTVGGLTRGPNKIQDVKLPGELPDPEKDPEAWRAAVRLRAVQPKKKEELN